jgi:hypothetical protein
MSRYDFLTESYRTERLKTLGVWSQVPDARMTFRPEPRARTPHEHMVHQCVSEDTWMRSMLGIPVSQPNCSSANGQAASGRRFRDRARRILPSARVLQHLLRQIHRIRHCDVRDLS